VSYYAFFKGWLLPSLPPGYYSRLTTFLTKKLFEDLSDQSGLSPFRHRTLAPEV